MATPAWISLGSNLGDRRAILDAALRALDRVAGVVVVRVSSYHETAPVGGPAGQGPFLNAAARLETTLAPRDLLEATQAIERDLGRVRTVRWGERTLDIDLLIFGSQFIDEPDLKLPHPQLTLRRFVLRPLVEIEPNVIDTFTQRTASDLLANLGRKPRIIMLDKSIVASAPELPRELATWLPGILPNPVTNPRDGTPPSLAVRAKFVGQMDSIRSVMVDIQPDESRWLIFDFVLDPPSVRRGFTADPADYIDTGSLVANPPEKEPRFRVDRKTAKDVLDHFDATLIVAAPDSDLKRRPGIARTPILWPEATDPDEIVDEVVAV